MTLSSLGEQSSRTQTVLHGSQAGVSVRLMVLCLEVVALVQRKSSWACFSLSDGTKTDPEDRHDDITYQSIAKAFGLKLKLYEEAYQRMKKMTKPHPSQPAFNWDEDSPVKTAKLRMVELPTDESIPLEKQFIFPREDMWVPVAVVNGNVHILPGVPRLCKSAFK